MEKLDYRINILFNQCCFTRRFALFYINLMNKEFENMHFNKDQIEWAHSKGFLLESALAYGLNETNYKDYLSDYDYYRLWPLNSPYRIWINDKLTLKYILPSNIFGDYLPRYYFYVKDNSIMYLLDCNQYRFKNDISGLKKLLREEKVLAMKLVNGTGSNEFYKLSFDNGFYLVNGQILKSEIEFEDFIFSKNYHIVTEYLFPTKELSLIHDKIHTIRLMVINQNGNDPEIVHGYLRFGTNAHGEANHLNTNDCKADYDYVVQIDIENGEFENGTKVYSYKTEKCPFHPDTKVKAQGIIPGWNLLKEKVLEISKYLFAVEYLGFDIGITEEGFKVIEINSHQGIKYLQVFRSLYDNRLTSDYFKYKLKEIDNMNETDKKNRFLIPR